MLLLGVLAVLTFAFAGQGSGLGPALPAYWVSLLLSVAAGSSIWAARSQYSGVGLAMALGPTRPAALFIGLFLAFGLTVLAVGALLGLFAGVLFDVPRPESPLALVSALLAGGAGLAALGVVIQQLGALGRLGPIVMAPLGAPLVMLAARASQEAYQAQPSRGPIVAPWILLLLFLLLGTLLPRHAQARQ
jgi:ABC-type transport system involved in cytochrome c biogenesis permease component